MDHIFAVAQGLLLHRVAHIAASAMMTCDHLGLLEIRVLISPLHREHASIVSTHHLHIHLLMMIVLLILHIYVILPVRVTKPLTLILLHHHLWLLLYHPLSIQIHGHLLQPLNLKLEHLRTVKVLILNRHLFLYLQLPQLRPSQLQLIYRILQILSLIKILLLHRLLLRHPQRPYLLPYRLIQLLLIHPSYLQISRNQSPTSCYFVLLSITSSPSSHR